LDKYAEEGKNKDEVDKQIIEAIKESPFYEKNLPSDIKVV
jgi:hypothetical protein